MSLDVQRNVVPGPPVASPSALQTTWRRIRGRIFSGLLLVAPIFITLWLVHWLYTALAAYAIDPLARLVILKFQRGQADESLPAWFRGRTQHGDHRGRHRALSALLPWLLDPLSTASVRRQALVARIPVISVDSLRRISEGDSGPRQKGRATSCPQRVVLVPFPHPGMKLPAFVTGSCRDIATRKVILCVYVPTTPVPTLGLLSRRCPKTTSPSSTGPRIRCSSRSFPRG